jgi:DNA-binding NtrC family response regulator
MPHERVTIGVIEDDHVMGGTLVHRLELEGYAARWWRTGEEAIEGLRAARPDLIVCDIRLPDMSGEDVFLRVLPSLAGTPFLFVTAFGQIEQAVRLTKAGAVDYIAKPYAITDLLERIPRLIRSRPGAVGALGASEPMRRIETLLRRVADVDSSLLFVGESGVGKEVAARFVHGISARGRSPFIAVNCAAIPNELMESELFGHEKGSFTGAHARHHGYVERARDGVLFLDEVGELPLPVQAKLLRLLQERSFTRLGGESAIRVPARIVCATNADLEQAVADGRFRRDLYYRIDVVRVTVAPLRERADDVLPLAAGFLREFCGAFGREVHGFTPAAEQALLAHDWPGNVRELRNRVERAVALAEAPWIGPATLFPSELVDPRPLEEILPSLAEIRERAERHHIRAALARVGGRVDEAAKLLGVARSTLFEKMRKLAVDAYPGGRRHHGR